MRLTRAGWIVAGGGPALTAAGLLLGYPFLTGLGFAAIVAVIAAILATLIRYQVRAERTVTPPKITVGGEVRMSLAVQNLSALPAPGFTGIVHIGSLRTLHLPVPALGGRGRAEVSSMVTASQRGLIRLSPVAVQRRDPLGLAHRAAGFSAEDWLWVHPRVHQLKPLPAGLVLDFEGRTAARLHQGSSTFHNLREYHEGDDPRHIHWRTTARTGTLTVRHHVDTTEPSTGIVLDTRVTAMPASVFEEAVEAAASISAASARASRPFTLTFPGLATVPFRPKAVAAPGTATGTGLGDGVSPGPGRVAVQDFLDRLAMVEQGSGGLPDLLSAMKQAESGGALVVITGESPDVMAAMASQRRRFSQIVVISLSAGAHPGGAVNRRPGLTVLSVRRAAELVSLWPSIMRGPS
jgi:hypothetical protein